ncbi:hypothetical protein CK203_046693 [Vitis vinifera]|uniref:BED-type domain-containing protein n=1 Tax=Vitis vinifera TaxID=29760 RepID=A0A438HJU7_VITVI|nr:hypothetical protein CK203_046693 [Vitis vinifera]
MSSSDSKNSRKDFVWKYVMEVSGEQYLRCKFCNQRCTGGVNRLKHHLAGTHHGMKPCNKVSEDPRLECKEALANFKDKKTKRNELLQEIGMSPTSMHESALSKTIGTLGSGSGSGSVSGSGESIPRGPMDKFTISQPRQSTLNSKWKQEERKEVCRKIGRFMYSKGLSFNTVNDPYWFPMIDVVANFGPGFKPPSMHELRTWILKEEVNDLSIVMEDHKKAWKQYGCSIMSDGWTDGKKIGEENVVQVITDNASNYVNVGMRLMEKRSRLWWTLCAAHCIDLMLEDIGKLNGHATTLSRARQVVKFIYGHTWVLSLMRTFTKNHELIRLAITQFATAFLTLQSLYKQKQALIAMFSSEKWCSSTWAKNVEGVKTRKERPAMGYIYELMDSAKEKIAFNYRGMERKYGPIWRKIDARWTSQLHRPLHVAGYYLNPQLRYGDKFSNVDEVRKRLFECMDRMLDYQERLKADIQLDSYDQAMGEFGSRIAIDSRTLRSPTKEIDSDDEWIAEKEDPLLPLDLCWLQDNELFNVDAIRVVSSNSQETQASSDHMVSSHSYKRKHNEVPSTSGGKDKEKELNLTPIDEDEDLDEMGIHDNRHFPTIDTLDEDDDDLGEEDLS